MASMLLGQYINKESIVHNLNPKIKIISSLLFVFSLLFTTNLYFYTILFLIVIILSQLSKIGMLRLLKGLKALRFLIVFMLVFNILLFDGDGEPLFSFWIIDVYAAGLIHTFFLVFRLVIVISYTSLLTLTTKPIELSDAIEELLKPLQIFKVPAHEIGMMISIALRFIPTLFEETDKIMKAQASRGIDFVHGSIKTKIKGITALIIPLFIGSLQRAYDLADAMEVRGYSGTGDRTKLRVYKNTKIDIVYLVFHILLILISIILLMRRFL